MRRILISVLLLLLAVAYIILVGGNYVITLDSYNQEALEDGCVVTLQQDSEVIKINRYWIDGTAVNVDISSVNTGYSEVWVEYGQTMQMVAVYSHPTGVITVDSYLGDTSGGMALFLALIIFFIYLSWESITKLRKNIKEDFYSYKNVTYYGITLFLLSVLLYCALLFIPVKGFGGMVRIILGTNTLVSFFAIPFALLITVIVGIGNIVLMIREGISKNNVLGVASCILFSGALIFPKFLDEYLQRSDTFIDVHRENGMGHLLNELVVNNLTAILTYLLFILIGTMIMTIRSAVRKPNPDRDYIIILGCKVRKDGSLTPLLRGRADAALRFAAFQKEKTGKDIIFVPSGGKGSDEIISEGEAIASYLKEQGVDEDHILVEKCSTNTRENFALSLKLITSRGGEDPKIAFATSNYHVLRSGFIASKLGINAIGVGSRTRWYFWLNAFIRELIATLHHERKLHLKFLAATLTIVVLLVLFDFSLVFF